MDDVKVLAVVVTYNRFDLLVGAIESIRLQKSRCDILVINNGSSDGTAEWLDHQNDICVINQDNVGGAGGFYTGLKYAAECGKYDFAWVMDDDIVANSDTLEELYNAYLYLKERDENIGILASEVLDKSLNPVNVPRILSGKVNATGYSDWPRYLSEGILPIDIATFVSLLIPISVIKSVGLPIKEFFIWGDDTEYTLRVAKKYDNFYVGKSKILHLRNGGILNLDDIKDPSRIKMYRFRVRNNLYLYRNNYYGGYKKAILFYIKKLVKYLLEGKMKKCKTVFIGLVNSFSFKPIIYYVE